MIRFASYRLLATASLVLAASTLAGCAEYATHADEARRKGLALYEQEQYLDAAGSFQNAVRQRPRDWQSHYYLGLSYEQVGQLQRAIQAYKSSLDTQAIDPKGRYDTAFRNRAMDALARAIAKTNDTAAEIKLLQERIVSADKPEPSIILARLYRNIGDIDSAIATYQAAHTQYPRDFQTAKEYGLYLESLGLTSQAGGPLSAANSLQPFDTEVSAALARISGS